MWWRGMCAVLMLVTAVVADARSYSVYTPAEGAAVEGAFNIVVRDAADLGSMPGTLEISAVSDFSKISFRTSAWRGDSQWWVASVPDGILDSGRNYWRITDADGQTHTVECVGAGATSTDIVRDPECHIVYGDDGSVYTLTNMWVRNEGFGNGLDESNAFPGRAAAGLAVTGTHLIVPEFRTDYTNTKQTFKVYDRLTGKYIGATSIDMLGNYDTHIWNKRRFEEAGNDDAGNCWIGSAFNVCDAINSTPVGNNEYAYYSDVLAGTKNDDTQYLLVEVVDFKADVAPAVKRRIKLVLPASVKSDDFDKFIVSGIYVRGNLMDTDFEVYAGAFGYKTPGAGGHTLKMLKWTATGTDRDKTVTINNADIYENDKLPGQNAQVRFVDDSHFLLNSTDNSYVGITTPLFAHPSMCVAGSDNGYTYVSRMASFDTDATTLQRLQEESNKLREETEKPAQRPQTGSAIHTFNIGTNTFMVYSYTMQPLLQMAVRGLRTPIKDDTEDLAACAPVLFPSSPWTNIYMSVRPVGIGAIRTVSDADGADMYLYMPPSTLARYRLSSARSTAADALTDDVTAIALIRTGNTLRLTGPDIAPDLRLTVTDTAGRPILSCQAPHDIDTTILPPGLYIAHAPGAAPLKFAVR